MTRIVLYYADKNWRERGYANNVWLNIYPDTKNFSKIVTMYSDIGQVNIVEVKRKADINDMINYLKAQGYTENEYDPSC